MIKRLLFIFLLLPMLCSAQRYTVVKYLDTFYYKNLDAPFDSVKFTFPGWSKVQSKPTTLAGYGITDAQGALTSGTNIKTVNGSSILGSGDLTISTGVAWGAITGTLSSQSDLQTALNAKQASLGYTPLNPANNLSEVTAATARTNLGATTAGANIFTLTNPSAISFIKIAADNTVSTRTPAQVLSDISGVSTSTTVNGHALSGNVSVTASDLSLGNVTNESKATMFTNATFTGTFTAAAGSISNAALANSAVANLSGTNTGDQTISDATISTSNITTNNVSTSKHGFAPILPNDATKYMDGTGAYSVPAGTSYTFSTGLNNSSGTITDKLATGFAGGQTVIGGTAASENLTLSSTSNGTKGQLVLGDSSFYDETNRYLKIVTNNLSTSTLTEGLYLANNTSATASTNPRSPAINWEGEGWSGAASVPVRFRAVVSPSSSTVWTWALSSQSGAGGWSSRFVLNNSGQITTGTWQATRVAVGFGGTGSDLSATGGTSQVLKQVSSGAAVTVAQLAESDLSFTDITTNNVTTSQHGFIPKAPNVATQFWRGDASYAAVQGSDLSISDVTTNNATTSAHGFQAKGINVATEFYRSDNTQDVPLTKWRLVANALGSVILYEPPDQEIYNLTTSTALASGTLVMTPVYVEKTTTLTGVKFWQVVQGSYTADQVNGIALYSYSGGTLTQVAISANDGTIWKASANTLATVAFTGTYSAAPGVYLIVGLYHSSAQTTAPTIGGGAAFQNGGNTTASLTNSAKVSGTFAAQTTLASSLAMSSFSTTTAKYYFALY